MIKWLLAGAAYFALVFTAAFALGIVRVTFIVPMMGEVWATLLELPFTLAISWLACAWIMRRVGVASLGAAIVMGAGAFALLMGAEALGATLLFGLSFSEHLASYATAAGALGLAGQIAFALIPLAQLSRDTR